MILGYFLFQVEMNYSNLVAFTEIGILEMYIFYFANGHIKKN